MFQQRAMGIKKPRRWPGNDVALFLDLALILSTIGKNMEPKT